MDIIVALVVGFLVGGVAKLLMPGKDPGGCIITILIGLAGSFVGTYLGQALGFYDRGAKTGFIGAVIGAMLLLIIYRMIRGKSAS